MPIPRLIQISAWSYSRYTDYDQCPFLAKCKIIDRLREPDSKAGIKGTRIHSLAAVWASKKLPAMDKDNAVFYPELKALIKARTIPTELAPFESEFEQLRKMKSIAVESEWAFTKQWEPTSWFGSDAWLRIKVDLYWLEAIKTGRLTKTKVHIVDHKSGREYEEHKLQRSLYALGALLKYPEAVEVTAAHWYLDGGTEGGPDVWHAEDLPRLQQEWLKRTTAMLNDTTYAPHPSDKCKWCHFRKANGGPCKF